MLRQPTGLTHHVASSTHIGRSHRKNQDTGGAWTWERPDGVPASLAVVADGVSAGENSERASRLALETIWSTVGPRLEAGDEIESVLEVLVQAAERASQAIAAQTSHGTGSDATTLSAAVCIGAEVAGAWCGDSRAYHLSPEGVARLTTDHSWAEGVVSHGLMTAEQAASDPRAHMITRWLGPQEGHPPSVDTFRQQLGPGDALLCCSDGLYMYFIPPEGEEKDMAAILLDGPGDLAARLERLVTISLKRGGHDDITGAAVQVTA